MGRRGVYTHHHPSSHIAFRGRSIGIFLLRGVEVQLVQVYELLLPYGSKGKTAATAAMRIYRAAQMYIGTGVFVWSLC